MNKKIKKIELKENNIFSFAILSQSNLSVLSGFLQYRDTNRTSVILASNYHKESFKHCYFQ